MARRGGFPGGMGGFGGMNLNNLMKEAKKMQADLEKTQLQDELKERTVEATAGGEAVKVVVNGSKNVVSLAISPEAVDPDDVEMLQDLIITCVNDALSKVDSATEQQMGKFNIPGIM